MNVYLDNAATTPLDPLVLEAMQPYLTKYHGNPSSIHSHGRKARNAIEQSRKKIAELLNVAPAEIFFTSGGTESDNTAILGAVKSNNISHIISSPIEHYAVIYTLKSLEKKGIKISYLTLDKNGMIDIEQLKMLLATHPNSMVTLMHANNEIGNLLDLQKIGELCNEYQAIFHSDTVQSIAHHVIDFKKNHINFAVGSAHKFHGPKGIGFLYIDHRNKIDPLILGGSQERNMRGGTENVYGIVGIAKAMEITLERMEKNSQHIKKLKTLMIKQLKTAVPEICFNGLSENINQSLHTILNIGLPKSQDNDMLLFNLDIEGISLSGGSACSSGTNTGSHVLNLLGLDQSKINIRISFSRYNTEEEINYVVNKLANLIKK